MFVTVQKKYFPHMFLIAYTTTGLRVNVLKDNIEMDIKKYLLCQTGLNLI